MHSQGSGSPPSGGRDGRGGRGRGQPFGRGQATSPRGSQQGSPPRGAFGASPPGSGRGQGFSGFGQVFGSPGASTGGNEPWRNPITSPGLNNNPTEPVRYLVNHFGQWILCTPNEARNYHSMSFPVYNSGLNTLVPVTDFNNPLPAPDTGSAFDRQTQAVYDAEDRLRDAPDEERYGKKTPTKGKNGSNQSTPSRRGHGSPDNGPGSGNRDRRGPPGGGAGGVAA